MKDRSHQYFVYVLTNRNNSVLYVGMTNNLERRMQEHKDKLIPGFTQKYNCNRLVWYEFHQYVNNAIYREKKIKVWPRQWKENLINRDNPKWLDLSRGWK